MRWTATLPDLTTLIVDMYDDEKAEIQFIASEDSYCEYWLATLGEDGVADRAFRLYPEQEVKANHA